MSKLPLATVVIPAYNVSEYIGECLESLLSQSYRDMEILVVDDGSTDGTADIVRRYANADSRITLGLVQPELCHRKRRGRLPALRRRG